MSLTLASSGDEGSVACSDPSEMHLLCRCVPLTGEGKGGLASPDFCLHLSETAVTGLVICRSQSPNSEMLQKTRTLQAAVTYLFIN